MTKSQRQGSPSLNRRLLGGLVGIGLCSTLAAGCGGAAKQTNTDTNTGANTGAESQPDGNGSESQPSK